MDIVVATGNPHKVEEIGAIFAQEGLPGVRLLNLRDVSSKTLEPAESGSTFEANATIKALSYAEQTGLLCLADDSGLEIDALDGRPGVISSHYCTDGREQGMPREERDQRNNQRVLRELEGVDAENRTARFVCVMVLAGPGAMNPKAKAAKSGAGAFQPPSSLLSSEKAIIAIARGSFEGRIGLPGEVPRSVNGFGYDPLFLVAAEPHRFSKTSAELPSDEKNRLSHRGMAARRMAAFLRGLRDPSPTA